VPGTSHVLVLEKPETVNRIVAEFVANPAPPQTLMPIRRQPA
jgi:hypothetical protein